MQDPSFAVKLRALIGSNELAGSTSRLGAILHPAIAVRDVEWRGAPSAEGGERATRQRTLLRHADCPISNYYSHEIRRICDDYAARGLGCSLVYIDPTI